MSEEIESLIEKIEDSDLREALREHFQEMQGREKFGLVFEHHQPESVRLSGMPVRIGQLVQLRDETAGPFWRVIGQVGGEVDLERPSEGAMASTRVAADQVVVVSEIGQPIHPGLKSLDRVERGGDKPFHAILNAENFHALETLLFAHEGQVDCIYIDPPYNNGANDWKYNNRYTDSSDAYRHSKWLSFMHRRLTVARRLLNPHYSVLIVTIDEKEVRRLGLLLEEVFPEATIQMVTAVINPRGTARNYEFCRIDEYIYFVFIGSARVQFSTNDMLNPAPKEPETVVRWRRLGRGGRRGRRGKNPGSYFPIFVDAKSGAIHSIGEALEWGASRESVQAPEGTIAVWPPSSDGQEYSWSVIPETLREIQRRGGLKAGRVDMAKGSFPFSYVTSGMFAKIESGEIAVVGHGEQGEMILEYVTRKLAPRTVWNQVAHDAGSHGTALLQRLIPRRRFPFPKSLYVVEDSLRFAIAHKPDALVIDFFGGSGTTAHAVARLNRQDGGRRRSIVITNNEVAPEEARALQAQGHRPGEQEWEAMGIAHHITWPRIKAALTGISADGEPVVGTYPFNDIFPMAEGLEENAEFFELTYQDPTSTTPEAAFAAVAPLLWLAAGAEGTRIGEISRTGWALPADCRYGVLFDTNAHGEFLTALNGRHDVRLAFIVTDSAPDFAAITAALPEGVQGRRVSADLLSTISINDL